MTKAELLKKYQGWINKKWTDSRTDANKPTELESDLDSAIKDEIKIFLRWHDRLPNRIRYEGESNIDYYIDDIYTNQTK